jgi:hypothetical protein
MKKLILAALLVAMTGCAAKHPPIITPIPINVYVPVPDCDNLQLLADAIMVCLPEARIDTGDVQGLCQLAIDSQKMRACLEDFGVAIRQQVVDCREIVEKAKDPNR